ncbi:transporter [Metallosphaera tengchongensis]|uniref:Transporter n=1 Tax=Metallosphaera tengchongensis TaxID=1532350 RepID=A0A6N0NU65_9CREN|nr:transporter [Metallosphaera tengchongensis]QKR00252.1 transporter [Metallosphaera tengchongensis]
MSKQTSMTSNVLLPIIGFSLSSYTVMNFIFYLNYLNYNNPLSYILIGAPFIGRIFTPITYNLLYRFGTNRLMFGTLGLLGSVNLVESFTGNFDVLLALRVISGILFGLTTSESMRLASESGSNVVVGLTMGGWALGWVLSAVSDSLLGKYMLLPSSALLASFLFVGRAENRVAVKGSRIALSAKALLVFLLGLEPAYILQVIPSILGSESVMETIASYSVSFLAYIGMSFVRRIRYVALFVLPLVGGLGFVAFISSYPWLLAAFTVLGLGINAVLPIMVRSMGVEPRKIGPSMNLASISGFLIPVLVGLGNVRINSALLTLLMLTVLSSIVFIELRDNSKVSGK